MPHLAWAMTKSSIYDLCAQSSTWHDQLFQTSQSESTSLRKLLGLATLLGNFSGNNLKKRDDHGMPSAIVMRSTLNGSDGSQLMQYFHTHFFHLSFAKLRNTTVLISQEVTYIQLKCPARSCRSSSHALSANKDTPLCPRVQTGSTEVPNF